MGFSKDWSTEEIEKVTQLLTDMWHNQAIQIKWMDKIHAELKKLNETKEKV